MNLNIYISYLIFDKFFIYRDIEIELSHHVSHDTTLMYLTCTIVELSIIYLNEMMRSITYFVTQFAKYIYIFYICISFPVRIASLCWEKKKCRGRQNRIAYIKWIGQNSLYYIIVICFWAVTRMTATPCLLVASCDLGYR